MKPTLLYTTFADIQVARDITDILVQERLAACVNLLGGMESSYMWEGKLERGQEVVAIIKTTTQMQAAAMQRLAELHPYETPCILCICVENGHMPYVSWLLGNCTENN